MKILQISSAPISFVGGTEKVIWEISRRLAKKHSVTILQTTLYLPKKITYKSVKKKEGVKIITCKNDLFLGGYGYSKEFKKNLKAIWQNFDLVHIHGYGRFTSDFSLHFLKGKIPIVFSAQGFFHTKKALLFKMLHKKILGKLLKNAIICTALTPFDISIYTKFGIRKRDIVVIPGGVDTKKFKRKVNVTEFKKKYNLKKRKVVLFVGRIHKSKGLQFLIPAIKELDCKLLIIGKDTDYKKELESLVAKLNIASKVIFTGPLSDADLVRAYQSCDMFVLPSEWEGFGLVLVEAMAAGKPVIGSNRGAIPFLIKNNQNGFIIEYSDVTQLTKKIELLLQNKKIAEKLGIKGKKFAKNFDWENIIKKYLDVYKKVIK